ncbi:YheC/YheD family protein [Evansella sp. AB-rgal1]|uniref:YheC/YheD family endospore coat-associated protein n=1 Tax=Evansella sp. AB-rgal1 TaxID=3242696 RepID=UPI00359E03E2
MTQIIEIKKGTSQENALFISPTQCKTWKIQQGETKTIQFGTKEIPCTIYHRENLYDDECILSAEAWDELYIPFSLNVTVEYDMVDRIYLGPIIGIFTAGFTGSILRPIGERSFLFAKYIHAAQTSGSIAFVFGSHHIHWNEGVVEGYTFLKSGWKKIKLPIPNVVYDRLPNRKTEKHPSYSEVRERLQTDYDIPWFNPGFFSKSSIYDQLIRLPHVNKFLPVTIASPTQEEIKKFVHDHKHVYIKPKNGSLGLGIHQIIFDEKDNFYYCRFRDHTRNRLRRYSSLSRLLKTQFPSGYDHLVIQQGIDLLKYQNNPIDFRVHTNKDEFGNWKISAIAAKIAGTGSVTTHVKSGGHVKSVNEIWSDLQLNKSLLEDLKKAAISLTLAIDETTDGHVGEIGFDLGIDEEENVWMFEANSKPGRTIFSHPKLKKEDHLTRKMPMTYAAYLYQEAIQDMKSNSQMPI